MLDPDVLADISLSGIDAVRAAIEAGDHAQLRGWAEHDRLRLAQFMSELREEETILVARLLGDELTAELVTELDPSEAADLLERLPPADAADVLEEMAPDDAADIVEELGRDDAETVLGEMSAAGATEIRGLMAYRPDSAGGRMTPEFVALRPDLTVEQAVAEIRRLADEAESVHYVYVTDADGQLMGVLSLRDLLLARSRNPVTAVMTPDVVKVRVTDDQEEVARTFRERRFTALPVVAEGDRMVGIITVDDVREVIEEETTEDIERLGGSQPLDEPYIHASVFSIFRKRIVWLGLLFVAQAYTSTVIEHFQEEILQVVILAAFIPLLTGTGGNVGSQTITTLVRAMGVGDVVWGDLLRVLWKELRVAFMLASTLAIATLVRARLQGVEVDIAVVLAISACFIVVWAALVAAVLPLTLRRLGLDPAVVSAPLITTLVDGTGLFIYFETARYLLDL